MPLVTVPPALQSPLPHDAIDEAVPANRAAIIEAALAVNDHEARLAALEAADPPAPAPVVTITIPAGVETTLSGVPVGSAAILRGPTIDFVMVRQ